MKYLGEKRLPDPRTGNLQLADFDLFLFECKWCEVRGVVGAPIFRKEWPFHCPGCSRKYNHWRPNAGSPGIPDLVPMIDLYERTQVGVRDGKLTGRAQPVPRLEFPGYVPDGRPNPIFQEAPDG